MLKKTVIAVILFGLPLLSAAQTPSVQNQKSFDELGSATLLHPNKDNATTIEGEGIAQGDDENKDDDKAISVEATE